MKRMTAGVIALSILTCGPAAAQDTDRIAGLVAAGVEGFGQSLGEAVTGGSSIFVTATGRADLPGPVADAYLINVEGRSGSAVEAARLRDQRLKTAQEIAARFNVEAELGSTGFARESDTAEFARRNREQSAAHAAHPETPFTPLSLDDVPRVFIARTGVRFHAREAKTLPPFLDALNAAGIDNLSGSLGISVNPLGRVTETLGFGAIEKIDPAVWDRASRDAVAAARRQADLLASASGRQLGEARQVLLLTRSVQGDVATVTIAARFAFAK